MNEEIVVFLKTAIRRITLLSVVVTCVLLSAAFVIIMRRGGEIAPDQIKIIGQYKDYYLVHRISGWQDKSTMYQIFNNKPSFDKNGLSTPAPLSFDEIDQNLGYVKGVTFKNNQLTIVYTHDQSESVDPMDVKLTIE